MALAAPISITLTSSGQHAAFSLREMVLAAPICAFVWLCQHCLPSTRNTGRNEKSRTPSNLLLWPSGTLLHDPYDDPHASRGAGERRRMLTVTH